MSTLLLTTTREINGRLYMSITDENEHGIELGPFGEATDTDQRQYLERIERHVLIHWRDWHSIINDGNIVQFDIAVQRLTFDCMIPTAAQHEQWMQQHPLPEPEVLDL